MIGLWLGGVLSLFAAIIINKLHSMMTHTPPPPSTHRDAEVLSLFAAIINKLRSMMEAEVPRLFEAVFECTLQMITRNFEDYPEHRLQFFALLHAIVNHCFRWGAGVCVGMIVIHCPPGGGGQGGIVIHCCRWWCVWGRGGGVSGAPEPYKPVT